MNKKLPVSISLAITIIAMTVTFSITWLVSMNRFEQTVSSVTQLQAQYSKLAEIDNFVRSNFFGDIDNNYLFDRVAAGYVSGLNDRYSVYYTADEYSEIVGIEEGRLLGIGIEVIRDADGSFRIARVYEDSPAARAGVQPNGTILAVDGVDTATLNTAAALHSLLRGEEGTELSLTCRHNVSDEEVFAIRRANYTAPTVESIYLSDYAYIRISAFTAGTFTEFDYAVRTARSRGVKGFVFDVRGNAGGRFANAYDIIDLLCPIGTIAQSEGRNGVVRVRATSDENAVDLPMVVLVNGSSSAAAELFAVSIRDLAGGQIVGTRTAGRGTYQSAPFSLPDGSAIVVTEAVLWTGADQTFNGVGVTPDVEAGGEDVGEMQLINPNPKMDSQILRGFEVLRAMVRERGEDPGPAITGGSSSSGAPDPSSSDPSSSDASDASGTSTGEGDGSGASDPSASSSAE